MHADARPLIRRIAAISMADSPDAHGRAVVTMRVAQSGCFGYQDLMLTVLSGGHILCAGLYQRGSAQGRHVHPAALPQTVLDIAESIVLDRRRQLPTLEEMIRRL